MNRYISVLLLFLLTSAALYAQQEEKKQKPLKNGRYRSRSETSMTTGTVVDHQFHGRFTVWVKTQADQEKKPRWIISEIKTYAHGNLNGLYVSFDFMGDTVSVGNFCNDRYCGEWRMYAFKELMLVSHHDSLGGQAGWQIFYNTGGGISGRQFYYDDSTWYEWRYYSGGFLKSRGMNSKFGREGTWYEYPEVNVMQDAHDTLPGVISKWENGKAEGLRQVFAKGILVSELELHNGTLYGIHREYRNGKLYLQETSEGGILNGTQYQYSSAGALWLVREYESGRPGDYHVTFDTITKKRVDEIKFHNGIKVQHEQWTPDGTLIYHEEVVNIDSLHYRFTSWYPDGRIRSIGESKNDQSFGLREMWYANGKKRLSAYFLNGAYEGSVSVWNEKDILVYFASVQNGRSCDDETVKDDRGILLQRSTDAYSAQAAKYAPADLITFGDYGYEFPEVLILQRVGREMKAPEPARNKTEQGNTCGSRRAPQFVGGEAKRVEWFQKNIRYPDMAREMGLTGTCYIQFTVKADSTISDVKVVKPIPNDVSIEKECIRVTKAMPKWIPAKQNGKPVDQKCVMPFRFQLVN